ncbi:MAG: hypothetical protein ACKPE3_37300, partial [Sphaerospermopsis kisseleviana]
IVPDENAYIIFDDTVLDKRFSEKIEIVRRQYSGNEHGIVKGIDYSNSFDDAMLISTILPSHYFNLF